MTEPTRTNPDEDKAGHTEDTMMRVLATIHGITAALALFLAGATAELIATGHGDTITAAALAATLLTATIATIILTGELTHIGRTTGHRPGTGRDGRKEQGNGNETPGQDTHHDTDRHGNERNHE